jgi:hypothetical protein
MTLLPVPGTSATKLLLGGQNSGWPGLLTGEPWLAGTGALDGLASTFGFSAQEIVDASAWSSLTRTAPPRRRRRSAPGASMAPSPLIRAAYNQFTDAQSLVYDWRSDVRDSGAKLLAFLEANRPANGRWQILVLARRARRGRGRTAARHARGRTRGHGVLASREPRGLLRRPVLRNGQPPDALSNADELTPAFDASFARYARTWPRSTRCWRAGVGRRGATLLDDAACVGGRHGRGAARAGPGRRAKHSSGGPSFT